MFTSYYVEGGNPNVVGLGEVRKALRHNMFQIQTYEENKTGQAQLNKNLKMQADGSNLESQLRTVEQQVQSS